MSLLNKVDVLVIGAGPSGTIAAAILKKAGLSVQIVEKTKFPRFVIGESLLPRCMEALEEAGLLDAIAKENFQRKEGAKFIKDGEVCDFSFSQQFTKGWTWTYQVPRARFDKALADACEEKGISISYETEVTAVSIAEDGKSETTVKMLDGSEETIHARFIIDGSGYGRVIPNLFGLSLPSTQHERKAVFTHIKDPRRGALVEPNRIIAIVHNPNTWIWAIPFNDGVTSLGFVGSPSFFEENDAEDAEAQMRKLIASNENLAARFKDCEMLWEPKTLQAWSATSKKFYDNGFVLTGNVTEFLDPIFSSGVTLASVSAQTAAKLVIRQLNNEQVDWQTEYADIMETGVDVFRTFVNRWYDGTLFKIFFAKERKPEMIAQICSVLAGYVWDKENPFVAKSDKLVNTLARYIETMQG